MSESIPSPGVFDQLNPRMYMPIKVIRWTSKLKLYLNWTKSWSKVNLTEQESMLHICFTSYGNFAVSVAVLNREGSATNKSALSSLSLQTFGLLQWSLDLTLSDFTGVKAEYVQSGPRNPPYFNFHKVLGSKDRQLDF